MSTTPQDKLRDLAKRAGPIAIAKVIVEDNDSFGISEHELTALVVECAKRDNPNLSEAQAFVKIFTDQSEAGVIVRKAFNVVKATAHAADVTSYPFPKFLSSFAARTEGALRGNCAAAPRQLGKVARN